MVKPPDGLGLGLPEADTVVEGLSDKEAEGLTLAEGLGVGLELELADKDGDIDKLELGETDNDGDRLSKTPSSVKSWLQVKLSTLFLMSKFFENLNAPEIPLSSSSEMPPIQDFISYIAIVLTYQIFMFPVQYLFPSIWVFW